MRPSKKKKKTKKLKAQHNIIESVINNMIYIVYSLAGDNVTINNNTLFTAIF